MSRILAWNDPHMADGETLRGYRASHRSATAASHYHSQFADQRNVKFLYWKLEQELLHEATATMSSTNSKVLDFACGTGRVLRFLADRFTNTYGVDISPQMLQIARESVPDAQLICADVTSGGTATEVRFDLITAFRFFLNAEKELQEKAIRWMHEHLADQGILICNFHLNPYSLVGTWRRLHWSVLGWTRQPTFSLAEARRLLEQNGFHVTQAYGYGFLFYSRRRLLGPVNWLLQVEKTLQHLRPLTPFGRNLLLIATKK